MNKAMTKAAWMRAHCAGRAKPNSHPNPFYIKTSHVGGRRTCCQDRMWPDVVDIWWGHIKIICSNLTDAEEAND